MAGGEWTGGSDAIDVADAIARLRNPDRVDAGHGEFDVVELRCEDSDERVDVGQTIADLRQRVVELERRVAEANGDFDEFVEGLANACCSNPPKD